MKQYYLAATLFLLIAFSCTNKKDASSLLDNSNLQPQLFTVDINKDTTLVTANGCILQLPGGSLQSDANPVQLEIKEALSVTDIVMGGLSTISGGKSLSSGGMIYFNAASGYKMTIEKEIRVLVPTKQYERNMQVFKGDTSNGKINWTDPKPLPVDETTTKLDNGKALFINNCSSCHKVDQDFVGPALYGITEKRSKEWIYAFTRHLLFWEGEGYAGLPSTDTTHLQKNDDSYFSQADMDAYYYHQCQKKKYGSEMPAFNLPDSSIKAIYTYIQNETAKRPDLKEKFAANCCDSCISYFKSVRQIDDLQKERGKLIENNESFFSLQREITVLNSTQSEDTTVEPPLPNTKVKPVTNAAVYYSINITAVGWYNIDILMKDYSNCIPSELMVRIQGDYKINFNVTLIIPSVKAFIEGGKLKNDTDYGFDENDGRIPLPQQAKCFILAFAEQGDKILFGKASFTAQTKQTIDIQVSETNKSAFKTTISQMGLDDVSAEIKDSKNAEQIRQADKKIKELEKLKPKNCDCDFPEGQAKAPMPGTHDY